MPVELVIGIRFVQTEFSLTGLVVVYVPMPPARYLACKSPRNELEDEKLSALIVPSKVTLARFQQAMNAESPIDVTPSGIITLARFQHLMNALSPIDVTLVGIVTLVRLVQ
jgi:hypothetical protein